MNLIEKNMKLIEQIINFIEKSHSSYDALCML